MSERLAARLYTSDGTLKDFSQWREDVRSITSHYCRAWLQTEYDTAIIRAHQAADWQGFETNKDVMPNLRWMPTTSPNPESGHRAFWERKLTLPVDDPFWNKHRPGDRYNCKCSLQATDEPVVPYEEDPDLPKPQPPHKGLENNPGKDGRIFSDKHPYYPPNCGACTFYKSSRDAKNWLEKLFQNRKKDCHNCPYVNKAIDKAKEAPRFALTEEQKAYRKELLQWAKETLSGKEISREEVPLPIRFTTKGIKEALNQPHKHYIEKNEALKDIIERIQQGKYIGEKKDDKGRNIIFHYIETQIAGEASTIVIKVEENMASFYGITEKR